VKFPAHAIEAWLAKVNARSDREAFVMLLAGVVVKTALVNASVPVVTLSADACADAAPVNDTVAVVASTIAINVVSPAGTFATV
jgi:hypothetical protein